jgi:tellurite methyltransferase
MKKTKEIKFDTFYERGNFYFSQEHSGGMSECLEKFHVPPCNAIDIGAGEGRNSLYLASLGFNVIAIEPSIVGAQKIKQKAIEYGLNINVINNNFLNVSGSLCDIDFVVALTSLEHMNYAYLYNTMQEIKHIINIGAYIYIVVFTEEDPGFKKDYENASECSAFIKHYFKKNELYDFFSDFEVLHYAEYVKDDITHGPKHYHGKAKLFACKK